MAARSSGCASPRPSRDAFECSPRTAPGFRRWVLVQDAGLPCIMLTSVCKRRRRRRSGFSQYWISTNSMWGWGPNGFLAPTCACSERDFPDLVTAFADLSLGRSLVCEGKQGNSVNAQSSATHSKTDRAHACIGRRPVQTHRIKFPLRYAEVAISECLPYSDGQHPFRKLR